jgi:hypothetical protein
MLFCLSGLFAQAYADDAQSTPINKISFAPLPIDIYLQPNDKPTVAFTTPCVQIEKMTHGFPPILAFETFMFQMISTVNDANVLPARLEPVCI